MTPLITERQRRAAEILRRRNQPAPASPLVPLKNVAGTRQPIFLIHPASGSAICYQELAERLHPDRPVYALKAPHPIDVGGTDTDLATRAATYITAIRAVWPGAYHLAGYSMGSTIAFEMASQLRRAGAETGFLGLIDGGAPTWIRAAQHRNDVFLLAGLARDCARSAGIDIQLQHEELTGLASDEAIALIFHRLTANGIRRSEMDPAVFRRFFHGLKARVQTCLDYTPAVYPGSATLFRSTEVEPESARSWAEAGIDVRDPQRGWDALLAIPPEIVWIRGFHATLIDGASAGELAIHIEQRLSAWDAIATRPA